ncbi:unnamed protein product [Medioppia subpectinata]|uniref:Aspartylglucosaminidase n=1 Tax=Medioppia subpectinata TaxID=1979941 RepID=A0A7R9Q5Z3_9ACAR|nr:unnamed protein product [Medioppia subpectinata]CAG2114256.1 unnamed protein product [Medioppia subpectinata]
MAIMLWLCLCLAAITDEAMASMAATTECVDSRGIMPLVINTWNFSNATQNAWKQLSIGGSALDAVEIGCSTCEREQCDHTVGWGGSPDENGETTLDALIMDGPTHKCGAVAGLRRVKDAISVARRVLDNTQHSLLVGDLATNFAIQMGFKEESLTSEWSLKTHNDWKASKCQPNYWQNVVPDPKDGCGPYKPVKGHVPQNTGQNLVNYENHDTIGMVAIDRNGSLAVGTSTNGLRHKIAGRVGDSPIPGAGGYVDQDVGAAAATGDGDIMLRYLLSYQAVEYMRQGMAPKQAGEETLKRVLKKYPSAMGAIVVVDKNGKYGLKSLNNYFYIKLMGIVLQAPRVLTLSEAFHTVW